MRLREGCADRGGTGVGLCKRSRGWDGMGWDGGLVGEERERGFLLRVSCAADSCILIEYGLITREFAKAVLRLPVCCFLLVD